MQEKLLIGEILKPQGILGEVKVKPYTDNLNRFQSLKEVFVEETPYKVLRARVAMDFIFLALSGVADRNAAELLRGKNLYVTRENAAPLKKNTYYIVDILGCTVSDEQGTIYGKVIDVTPASRDIYTVQSEDGKIMRFPLVKDMVIRIAPEEKQMVFSQKRLSEVSVYED